MIHIHNAMNSVLTVSGMRNVDLAAIGGDPELGYAYMRKAGEGLFDAIKGLVTDTSSGEIAIVCGKGNNGGDGYVAGKLLMEAGYGVMCFSLCECEDLHGEARMAFDEFEAAGGSFMLLTDIADCNGFRDYVLIIDALLGTGIKGSPRGLSAQIITVINRAGKPVIAVDTPSGLNNDTGEPGTPCIQATVTVTMGFPKIGAFFHPGAANVGALEIVDLGYPQDALNAQSCGVLVPDPARLGALLPGRKPAGSKIEHGLALLLCGSRGMTGSAVLASEAALRSGCGMVHLAAPASAIDTLSSHLVETVLHPIGETPSGAPSFKAAQTILDLAKDKHAACIGPGISHAGSTLRLVRELVAGLECPIILDADGINAFKGAAAALKKRRSDLVLTPHRGEYGRVFGDLPDKPLEIVKTLREKAEMVNATIVLKGNPTIVVAPGGAAYIAPFGNSALASAGTGDVLSGIIVSFMAQGCSSTAAAVLGCSIHGMCGTAASENLTEYSVIARDVIMAIPDVVSSLLN